MIFTNAVSESPSTGAGLTISEIRIVRRVARKLRSMAEDRGTESLQLDAILVYVSAVKNAWQLPRQSQLGLYYVAQHAVDAGYRVRVDNLSANDYVVRRLSRVLSEHSCRLLGLYVDHDNVWDLRRILPALKERQPHLSVVLGGPQVTADPQRTLERLPQALCGVIGEGEETFLELLSLHSFSPKYLKDCNGLAIRTEDGIALTPRRVPIEPLDRLSIPRVTELNLETHDLLPLSMITGRGCHGRCAFCYEGRQLAGEKRLRLHSTERCVEQFDYLAKQGDNCYICILDDSFVADHRRLREFCKELITRWKGRVKWFCEARVDTLAKHPDLLPLMIEAGLIRVQVGGESGSQRILDIYRKGSTLEQLYTVVSNAKESGLLSIYANFIVGGAFETHETYDQTRDFALRLLRLAPGCLEVGKSFYTPYPGTPMYEDPGAYGIEVIDKEVVTGQGDDQVVCRTEQLSRMEIVELGHDFEKSVERLMTSLCADLPHAVTKRHFEANRDYRLSTDWYEIFCKIPSVFGYFTAIVNAGAKSFAGACEQDFRDLYPVRNIELVASKGSNYLVRPYPGLVRELDTLEGMIIELSAGKLSFEDVVDVVCDSMGDVNRQSVREAIIRRCASFDEECLIVWRTNGS
jgi:anaerobic magnesium-protoporphyrin IX monomethyl ester cyclase